MVVFSSFWLLEITSFNFRKIRHQNQPLYLKAGGYVLMRWFSNSHCASETLARLVETALMILCLEFSDSGGLLWGRRILCFSPIPEFAAAPGGPPFKNHCVIILILTLGWVVVVVVLILPALFWMQISKPIAIWFWWKHLSGSNWSLERTPKSCSFGCFV